MDKPSHDSETPAHGKQVITACAFIHAKIGGVDKVFLPKRADTKKFIPGVYELPGGHIDFGEDIREGLKREILEEFNMTVTLGDVFETFTYRNKVKGGHSIEVIFFATFNEPLGEIIASGRDLPPGLQRTKFTKCSARAKTNTTLSTKLSNAVFRLLDGEPYTSDLVLAVFFVFSRRCCQPGPLHPQH